MSWSARPRQCATGRRLAASPKIAHRQPADGGRDPVAIEVECRQIAARRCRSRRPSACRRCTPRKSVPAQVEALHRGEPARCATGSVGLPAYSPATRRARRPARPAWPRAAVLVGDVVDHAAERVDRIHRVAPLWRQHAHAAVERGAGGHRLARPPRPALDAGPRRAERPAARSALTQAPAPRRRAGQLAPARPADRRAAAARVSRCARPTITAVSSRSRRSRTSAAVRPPSGSAHRSRSSRPVEHAPQSAAPWPAAQSSIEPRTRQQVRRQIAAVQRGQVLRAVLQMVQHLQRRAQRIRAAVGRADPRRADRAHAARPASPNSRQ